MYQLSTALGNIVKVCLSRQNNSLSLTGLVSFFEAQEKVLAHTPNVAYPRLDDFAGVRSDPTGEIDAGVDLAAPSGTKVVAPAEEIVILQETEAPMADDCD